MKLPRKGKRYTGQFIGYDTGKWYFSTDYIIGALSEYDWEASLGLYLRPALAVEGATEYNKGFLNALDEMINKYPELIEFTIIFDGPEKPIVELLKSDGELHFYHGTSSNLLSDISQDGLRPRSETGIDPVYGAAVGAKEGRPDAVYLTTQLHMARAAARDAVRKFGGEPVILNILNLDITKLEPDEDSREQTVEGSIARIGSAAYIGTIPPEDLSHLPMIH